MGALAATTPVNSGTTTPGAAVAATDTIARSIMGPKGVYLEILNGNAAVDNVTISDHGSTPAGNPLTGNQISASVTNGTNKVFHIKPDQVNPATQLVTVTHSVQTTVTYKLYPVG
jgi:hypothetical protein